MRVFFLKVLNVDNTKLCQTSQKFSREDRIKLFCLFLAGGNIFLFGNLVYDYYQYYVNGKLPKIIKWIPYL